MGVGAGTRDELQLLAAHGVLAGGHLVEVSRGDLVGSYIGWTARRTKEAFDRARGGVLFVDEAYALIQDEGGKDFGGQKKRFAESNAREVRTLFESCVTRQARRIESAATDGVEPEAEELQTLLAEDVG